MVIKHAASEGTNITEPLDLSKEDWLIIDEALHRVARSLRKIETEEKRKKLQGAEGQSPMAQ